MRILVLALLLLAAGCQRPPTSASASTGPKSSAGWEVRYNAALALARRGSPQVKDPEVWDSLLEMLDEDQQLRNFRTKTEDGRETLDETGARATVISALEAIQELHRKQPKLDISAFETPIEKLTRSPNATLSVQARQAMLTLFG